MQRILYVIFLACVGMLLSGATVMPSDPGKAIGISQMVEHPALDAVRLGLLASLKEQGFEAGKNVKVYYENAQGNLVTATQIASKLLSTDVDVLIGISTPSAQTLLYTARRNHKRIPIVFTAVSDPVSAKLEVSDYPITGITDKPNVEAILDLMQKMLPHLKAVGLLYNPSESNSTFTIEQFKFLLKKRQLAVYEATVHSTAGVAQAVQSLVGKVDALYFPQDNTVVSAIETVISITTPAVASHTPILPVFCSDPLLVKQGVLAAIGYDYSEIGRETGRMVARILQGKNIKSIPIHNARQLETAINKPLAQRLNMTVPEPFSR